MRSRFWRAIGAALVGAALALAGAGLLGARIVGRVEGWLTLVKPPIRVGLLHSRSGSMEVNEKSLVDAEILALEGINASGGLLGRRVEWVIADGKSEPATFAAQAKRLIEEDKVVAIFGCWTAESRKATKAVVEDLNNLLFFPGTFEGIDRSRRVIYAGGSSNQSTVPAVRWCVEVRKARRFFVVGTEGIWSRCTAEIAKDAARASGAEVVGEAYLPMAGAKVGPAIEAIKAARPDFVLNSLVGDGNEEFYRQLLKAGLGPEICPVMAFGLGEDELRRISPAAVAGHFAAMNYFQSLDRPASRSFVRLFKSRFGEDRSAGDAIVASYNAVRLWAQAVAEGESADPSIVINHLERQSIDAPEGIVTLDAELRIAWRPSFVGRARSDGQFDVVWSLANSIRPVLFVATRTQAKWREFLDDLLRRLGPGRPAEAAPLTAAPAGGPTAARRR